MALELAFPVHPGEILNEDVLPRFGLNVTDAAARLGVARPGFNNVLNGKRSVTPELALKIERVLGYPARLLLALQSAHDLARARHDQELAKRLAEMEPVHEPA
jgi:addiction module HigA family antidote